MDFLKARLGENSTLFGLAGLVAGGVALLTPPSSPVHQIAVALMPVLGGGAVVTPDRK